MSMELLCYYTKFPEPLEPLDHPLTPFPELSDSSVGDMVGLLEEIAGELAAEAQRALADSYLKILYCEGDVILPDSQYDPGGYCFSPDLIKDILAKASEIPTQELRDAIERHADSEHLEWFESPDHFLLFLEDIHRTFQQAADANLGIMMVII